MPRKSRSGARTTRRSSTWNGIAFRVIHTPDYLVMGADHVEIETIAPRGSSPKPGRPPLPITSTCSPSCRSRSNRDRDRCPLAATVFTLIRNLLDTHSGCT